MKKGDFVVQNNKKALKRGESMGLKTYKGLKTSVYLPSDVRVALRDKEWTILEAIRNGLKYRAPDAVNEEPCERPECIRAKKELIKIELKR